MSLGVGFKVSKNISSRLSAFPVYGLRCELPAAVSVPYLQVCLPTAMLSYRDGDGLLPLPNWNS